MSPRFKGQLIAEPTDEPLPTDVLFNEALEADGDADAIARDEEDGSEEVVEEFVSLQAKIREMKIGEKLRLALLGNAAARSILIRDPNKLVANRGDLCADGERERSQKRGPQPRSPRRSLALHLEEKGMDP